MSRTTGRTLRVPGTGGGGGWTCLRGPVPSYRVATRPTLPLTSLRSGVRSPVLILSGRGEGRHLEVTSLSDSSGFFP